MVYDYHQRKSELGSFQKEKNKSLKSQLAVIRSFYRDTFELYLHHLFLPKMGKSGVVFHLLAFMSAQRLYHRIFYLSYFSSFYFYFYKYLLFTLVYNHSYNKLKKKVVEQAL